MKKIQKRKTGPHIRERYLRIVLDYKAGYKIKEIMERNNFKSPQTLYNAIDYYNEEIEREQNAKRGSKKGK